MPLDDFLADRQTESGAGILAAPQPLEGLKNAVEVRLVDADAVVVDGKLPAVAVARRRHANAGRLLAAELDGVAQQVLEELHQLGLISDHAGQGTGFDPRVVLSDRGLEVGRRLHQRGRHVDLLQRLPQPTGARIFQTCLDQTIHAADAGNDLAK